MESEISKKILLLEKRISELERIISSNPIQGSQLKLGKVIIDKMNHFASVDNKEISLSRIEFDLLYFLANNANRVFSRSTLLNQVWGDDACIFDHTVAVQICKLRTKIGDKYISTLRGVGYKFNIL